MTRLTICLLNYKRKENYERIIPVLAAQSIQPRIFMWNNGQRFSGTETFLTHIDWLVESEQNMRCWPRWMMAAAADTEFVCSWDDDLYPKDHKLFEDVLSVYDELGLSGAVGPFGVEFEADKPYESCWHHKAEKMSGRLTREDHLKIQGTPEQKAEVKRYLRRQKLRSVHHTVDMIKGRHLLLPRKELLAKVPLWVDESPEDDIIICGKTADGQPQKHTVLGVYQSRFEDLDTDEADAGAAISRQADHFARRQHARTLFFPGL